MRRPTTEQGRVVSHILYYIVKVKPHAINNLVQIHLSFTEDLFIHMGHLYITFNIIFILGVTTFKRYIFINF